LSQPNLFDPKKTHYVFNKKLFSIVITDKDGNELAKSKGSSLFDNSGSLILKINTKIFSDSEIKDSEKNLIGKIQKRQYYVRMQNSKGEDLLRCGIPVEYETPYVIDNNKGEEIANITMNNKNQTILHIQDLSFDRKTLLGFGWIMTRYGLYVEPRSGDDWA
jgi:hypothetical protein